MSLLAIDRGNTFTKLGVFTDSVLSHVVSVSDKDFANSLNQLLDNYSVRNIIISSVRETSFDLSAFTEKKIPVLSPDSNANFPFEIDYENKSGIGMDRLANAAGAVARFGNKNVLVVDCGTCITYTLVVNNIFKGGVISPGVEMRLKALNYYTGRLPLVKRGTHLPELPGNSTEGSIRAGTELAAILETQGLIEQFRNNTKELNVLLTGGGMSFFEQHLKSAIFAAPYLTLEGLHEIFIRNKK